MATEAQTCAIGILANRPNAQKSTWPPNKPPISPNLPTIYNLFMQNEPNFRKSQVNVRPLVIMNYERKSDWTLGENEPKTNPNKANLKNRSQKTEGRVRPSRLRRAPWLRLGPLPRRAPRRAPRRVGSGSAVRRPADREAGSPRNNKNRASPYGTP